VPVYSITAPNGKTLDVSGDHVPSEVELHDIFKAAGVDTVKPDFTTTNVPLADVSAHAGVPARGRGTQLDLDKSNRGVDLATTPLARPTGIDAIDSFTSPIGLASLAAGGVGVARAGIAGGMSAAAKAALADASPLIKYEIYSGVLEHAGVPSSIARPAAMIFAGYKKGAKVDAPSTVPPPIVETAQEAMGRKMASAPAAAPAAARVPVAEPPVSMDTPAAAPTEFQAAKSARADALPDQKALNEARLAEIRDAYRAKQGAPAAAAPVIAASGKMRLTLPEWIEFQRLVKGGASLEKAEAGAKAAGAMARQFGLSQPTLAQTQFPKASRGK
jgi:hypothetical protein